jgi:hypothetical protein
LLFFVPWFVSWSIDVFMPPTGEYFAKELVGHNTSIPAHRIAAGAPPGLQRIDFSPDSEYTTA